MAPKNPKPKRPSITKEAAAVDAAVEDATSHRRQQWPWSELPPTNSSIHLRKLVPNMWPFNNLSSAPAVTKSWPPRTTTRCAAAHQPHQLRHVATCAANTNHSTPPPPHPHTHFLGEGASIVDAVHENPGVSQYRCILKSDTRAKWHPPSTCATTPHTYQPYVPGLELQLNAVTGPGSPTAGLKVSYTVYLRFSRGVFSGKSVSVWHECATADPFDAKKKFMELVSLVHCRGKFYAMSLQGALAVMQVVDTRLRITAVGDIRAAPFSNSSFFKEYMFEMNGEILLVFLIHRKSLAVVDHVEVFRLDLDKLCWIKVERLRGKTLFLKERCVWVESEEFGCRDDRVYFTEGFEKRWKVYDMKTSCISPVITWMELTSSSS